MDTQQRGQAAKVILENPLAKELLEWIEQGLIQFWKEAQDSDAREEAWYSLQGHTRFVDQLNRMVEDADFERALKEEVPSE